MSRARKSKTLSWDVVQDEAFDGLAAKVGEASNHVFSGRPTKIRASRERMNGRILSIKAFYGPGETVLLRFRKDGSYSLSFGIRITTKVGK